MAGLSFDDLPDASTKAGGLSFDALPDQESLFNQGLRAAATMAVRGPGMALDFMLDPLASLRHIISPSLERLEKSSAAAVPFLGNNLGVAAGEYGVGQAPTAPGAAMDLPAWAKPPGIAPPGTALGDAFFDATGIREMQPESTWGRIGMAAGTGAVAGGPFGVVPAILSAAGGALGQGTMEAATSLGASPDNAERMAAIAGLAPAFGTPLVRGPVNYAARQARETFGPAMSQSFREGRVGEELRTASSDAAALAQSLAEPRVPELVLGSRPTTFQYTGDVGIGQLERGQRTATASPFLERMQEQSAARVGAVQGMAPEGAVPGAVRDLLRDNLARLDAEGEANVRAATQNATQALEQAGGRLNPEDYGTLIRDQLEAAKAATKASASGLFKEIDPDGTLTINGLPVKQEAAKIVSEVSTMARQPEGAEAEVFANARMLGTASKFSDFAALRGNLLQAIREERMANGESPALRRMQMLRSAMDDAISNATENAAQRNPELFERLTVARERGTQGVGIEAATQAGGNYQTGAVGLPGGGSPAGSGLSGTVGQAARGSGSVAGSQGIPGDLSPVANFNEAAAVRSRAANDAWRVMKERFNNQFVGPVLAERGGGEYRIPESRVPERALSSPEGVQAFLDAGGSPATLQDALVGDLRRAATASDGSLNVGKYQSWLNRRAAALRAFPETEQSLGNVARAQETVDAATAASRQQRLDFERSAARHFLNAEPAQAVQGVLGGKNPVGEMTQLVGLVKSDPAGLAGLQRAVAEYVERNFIGNADALKSDAFQTFINRSGPALDQVFTPAQMQSMRNIATDLKRSNLSIAGSKIPGQSNTMQDLMLSKGRLSVLGAHLGGIATAAATGLAAYLIPGVSVAEAVLTGAGVGSMKRAINNIKTAGVEKLDALRTEALLNPEVAAALLMKATPANRPFIAAKLNKALGRTIGSGAADEERQRRSTAR